MNPRHEVTLEEQAIVMRLAYAWDAFLQLPVEHPSEQPEFMHVIHQAQALVLARAGRRQINA